MPPIVFIQPEFLEIGQEILETNTFNNHKLKTENEIEIDEETKEMCLQATNRKIQEIKTEIEKRLSQNKPTGTNIWDPENKKYHITYYDLTRAIRDLDGICENCKETIIETDYRAQATEYGTATLNIIEEATDHETRETNTDGNYEYTCKNCDEEINPRTMPYFIAHDSLTKLKEFLQIYTTLPNTNTEGLKTQENERTETLPRIQPGRIIEFQTRNTQQQRNTFPNGKQIQHDIDNHGPTGPQMKIGPNGTQISSPEDFLFRNTIWKCKNCEQMNRGESKKCGNTKCQKDKFTRTKYIKLTL